MSPKDQRHMSDCGNVGMDEVVVIVTSMLLTRFSNTFMVPKL